MAAISTHLHNRRFQVAISENKDLPLRKWNHIGTVEAVTSISAAYKVVDSTIKTSHPGFEGGVIFEFENGQFVSIKY
jgi:hypothetical protein